MCVGWVGGFSRVILAAEVVQQPVVKSAYGERRVWVIRSENVPDLRHHLVRTNAIDLFKFKSPGLHPGRDRHRLLVLLAPVMPLLTPSMARTQTSSTTIKLNPVYPQFESIPDEQELRITKPSDIEPRAWSHFHLSAD